MAVIKPISLAEENGSYQIWKELFGKTEANFSAWIQQKLIEEQQNNHNVQYLITKLNELNLQKEQISNEILKITKQIEISQQELIVKEQEICKTMPKSREQLERDFEGLIRTIGAALEFRFIGELPERQVWEDLAIEYDELKDKPNLDSFLESKGFTPKQILKKEVTL